ncbi:hypothetical protein RUM44_005250 [Polyplax serrata]|uniref:Uncharacterized protein n=1 Tax=Polyplax serrata TaxID=468196 RepID=A0ABR1AG17_POLSC
MVAGPVKSPVRAPVKIKQLKKDAEDAVRTGECTGRGPALGEEVFGSQTRNSSIETGQIKCYFSGVLPADFHCPSTFAPKNQFLLQKAGCLSFVVPVVCSVLPELIGICVKEARNVSVGCYPGVEFTYW